MDDEDQENQEFEDSLIALRANIDQALATIPVLAPLAMAWYQAFVTEGFDEEQALKLTSGQMSQATS